MTVLFQGAELEDFPTRFGPGVSMKTTPTGAYNTSNARGVIEAIGGSFGVEHVDYVQASFDGVTELWGHLVFSTTQTGNKYSPFWEFWENGTRLLAVRFNGTSGSDLLVKKYPGGESTIASSGSVITATNTRYALDWYIKIGNPGAVRLYVNNVLAAFANSIDLSLGGASVINRIRLTHHSLSGGAKTHFSEAIVADVPTIGAKLVTRIPDANGAHTEWAGGGFGDIDELTPDATILTSDAADQRASFPLSDFPAALSNEIIASLKLTGWARRGVIGPQNANLFARVGGADYHAADQVLTADYGPISSAWAANPAGGDWDAAALNAAEFGIRSRA